MMHADIAKTDTAVYGNLGGPIVYSTRRYSCRRFAPLQKPIDHHPHRQGVDAHDSVILPAVHCMQDAYHTFYTNKGQFNAHC